MTRSIRVLAVAVAVGFCAVPAARPAGAAPLEREEVDRFVRPLVDGEYCQAVVVGLVDERGTRLFGYGAKSPADRSAPDGDTVFEIGSVSKVFTSLLLADMVRAGEVALDDPVQKHLPAGVKVPRKGDEPITLAHLASHTSGLPRMPDNMTPKNPANPYADYTARQMYEFLSRCEPARAAGEAVEYSNLGAALLGQVLARRAGKTYEALVLERICAPLNMGETRVALPPPMRKRLAPGHDADGTPAPNWDLGVFAGAGGLRSTGNDMVKFVAANIRPESAGALAEAIRTAQAPRARADAANDVALGWHVQSKDKLVWHNGQTGGYHSFVGVLPAKGVGVVLLTNGAIPQPDAAAMALLRRMAGQPSEPPALRMPVKLSQKELDAFVGEYALAPAFKLTVTREGDRLMSRATGQGKARIYPSAENEFFYRIVDARITFRRGPGGQVSGLVLHQNGADLPGPKANARPATKRP